MRDIKFGWTALGPQIIWSLGHAENADIDTRTNRAGG